MYRKALIVGVGKPADGDSVLGDVNDMHEVLRHNYDNTRNFDCKLFYHAGAPKEAITSSFLSRKIENLFKSEGAISLFYFSGHGRASAVGASLCTMTSEGRFDEGVPFSLLLAHASNALTEGRVSEVVIILDCCYSGNVGDLPFLDKNTAILPKGLSILTASTHDGYSFADASRKNGKFTKFIVQGLKGGAADHLGEVSVASLYNFADKILGAWEQRPVYKSHVSNMYPIRKCEPFIPEQDLRRLVDLFPERKPHQLTPGHEPKLGNDPDLTPDFELLQMYNRVGFVKPDEPNKHMYDAADNSGSCSLTAWGEYYWELIARDRI